MTDPQGSVLDLLRERGFVKDTTDEAALRQLLSRPATVYWGCDATATSFHVGHQLGMMAAAWLQRYGHRIIILMGGGTTMVGDPSGKTSERPIMSLEQIQGNERKLQPQFERFLRFGDDGAMMVDNAAWLLKLNLIDFLRDVGSRVTVNHMLQHETYRQRLEEGGLTFLEFSYQLMQGYDYVHLFRTHGCRLQIGGSDQWANILAGVDLIRRLEKAESSALVWPLLTTSTGTKMGKTASGAVWLDASMLSPYDYYQFWINCDDADVERFLAIFTFLPMDEVKQLGRLQGAELRVAKERLAFEVTSIVHGLDAAQAARDASKALFGAGGDTASVPTQVLSRDSLGTGLSIADLAVQVSLYPSKREAFRKIAEGGLYINDSVVESAQRPVTPQDLDDSGTLLLRAGKKRFLRVRFE
jgi:tyrosyl-tRNA synthetase